MDDLEERVFGPLPDETRVYPGHGDDTHSGRGAPAPAERRKRGPWPTLFDAEAVGPDDRQGRQEHTDQTDRGRSPRISRPSPGRPGDATSRARRSNRLRGPR